MNITKRSYNNESRTKKAGNTKDDIMRAFSLLWTKYSLNDITLESVAKEASVTTRTILRKFGSKEKLIEECLINYSPTILEEREQGVEGDINQALKMLLSNYESIGDAAIRTINLEPEMKIARKIGEAGRKVHREWCIRIFSPYLPSTENSNYERDLVSFIASTEIYLWKLMRKDLKMSKEETFSVFKKMIDGLMLSHKKEKHEKY